MNHLFYADDMCLLAPSAMGLQQLIQLCEDYGMNHDILYNPVKTKCIVVPPNRYKLYVPSVTLNNVIIEYVDNVKYLGVVISSQFKDDIDITRQLRSLYASGNTILHRFSACSTPVKLQLLESYCLNFYCSTLWCNFTKLNMNKIRVAYNNIIRKLFGYSRRDSASFMFVHHQIDSFDCRQRKSVYKFKQRLMTCNNIIVQCINNNTWITNNYMWHRWNSLLFINF